MIRKPNGAGAKRLATGVLVAGVVAAGAVALAGPASAAGPVNTITISPTSQSTEINNCVAYTVTAKDTSGTTVAAEALKVTVSGTTGASICDSATYPAAANKGPADETSGTPFYVGSSNTGTVSIAVTDANNSGISTSATLNVATTINDTVSKITVNPSATNAEANQTVNFVINAVDANGHPVQGATVDYGQASTCPGSTDINGNLTCSIPAGTANSTTTFYVNQTAGGSASLDSGEPNAAGAITIVAKQDVESVAITCAEQDVDDTATAPTDCTVPAGTKSEKFTVTVRGPQQGTVAGKPLAGVVVQLSSTDGVLTPQTATTDANGQVTTTLTPDTTTNGQQTYVDAVVDSSDLNAGFFGTFDEESSVRFATRTADDVTLTPGSQSVANGGTVTETAKVTDQFGAGVANQNVTLETVGTSRNSVTINGVTNSSGSITLSYQDTHATSATTTDSLQATAAGITSDTATITYVATTNTASASLNFVSGTADPNPACVTDTTDPKTETSYTGEGDPEDTQQEVCVLSKNASGQVLSGQTVTFTVTKGTVGAGSDQNAGTSTTYTTTTNASGIAVAFVDSPTVGAQTISATAGGTASNTLTDTYTQGEVEYFNLSQAPTSATIVAGKSQTFTDTLTDQAGNPLQGYEIVFGSNGPGALDNSITITSASGTASANLTTATTDSGTGTVEGSLEGGFAACTATESQCTATSSYTVTPTAPVTTKSVTVQLTGGAKNGSAATATATVLGTDGNPVNAATVNFAVTGAETSSGSASTNGNGVATFNFTTTHSGAFTVTATSGGVSGTASGNTAQTVVSTSLALASTVKHQVMETATLSRKKSGITVRFYSVTGGVKTFVASATTNSAGVAKHTVTKLTSGHNYRAVARAVNLTPDYTGTYSPKETISVS